MQEIIEKGSVIRGWIGVEVQDVGREIADSFRLSNGQGALIAGVQRGGPADRAGVKPGDVIVAVDGKRVSDSFAVLQLVASLKPGSKTELTLLREGKPVELPVDVGKRSNKP